MTSAISNQTSILDQGVNVMAVQEHCVDEAAAARFKAEAKLQGWESYLGPTDPEHTKKSAGVGFLWKGGVDLMPITPCTKDYADAVATGRLLIMHYETTDGLSFLTNVYGWTGGSLGSIAAGRTNDLLKIAWNELALQPDGRSLMCGDINGDTVNFPILHALLQDGALIDIGANEQLTQKTAPDYTRQAKLGGIETRLDYILSTQQAWTIY